MEIYQSVDEAKFSRLVSDSQNLLVSGWNEASGAQAEKNSDREPKAGSCFRFLNCSNYAKTMCVNAAVIHNTKWTTKLTDNCLAHNREYGKQEQMESACYYAVTEHDAFYFLKFFISNGESETPLPTFRQQTQPSLSHYQFTIFIYKNTHKKTKLNGALNRFTFCASFGSSMFQDLVYGDSLRDLISVGHSSLSETELDQMTRIDHQSIKIQ